jgi:hypothetical protein
MVEVGSTTFADIIEEFSLDVKIQTSDHVGEVIFINSLVRVVIILAVNATISYDLVHI